MIKASSDTQLPPLHDGQVAEYPAIGGTLLYIANVSRHELCFTASTLARYIGAPTKELYQAAIGALKYLEGTKHYKLVLGVNRNYKQELLEKKHRVIAYGDADYANCVTTGRSVSGLVIIFDGSPVMWATRKQPIVAKSTTAAECGQVGPACGRVIGGPCACGTSVPVDTSHHRSW
jgi:hypothetical protein